MLDIKSGLYGIIDRQDGVIVLSGDIKNILKGIMVHLHVIICYFNSRTDVEDSITVKSISLQKKFHMVILHKI